MSTTTMSLSTETLAESDDERSQELGTIASIFPEELIILSPFSATLSLPVSPLNPLAVSFPSTKVPIRFQHLPPINLTFELPSTYPTDSPPNIELSTKPIWLPPSKLETLKTESLELWDGFQVVFAVIDHIQQSAERGFDLSTPFELSDNLRDPLIAFDKETKHALFNKGTYDCGICLEPKKGTLCHALRSCTHIFCRACLQDYYSGLITEGDVSSVRCSDPSCVKNATRPQAAAPPTPPPETPGDNGDVNQKGVISSLPSTLPPEELSEIGISTDLVTRYIVLKKKKALEKDPDTVYCPRQWCQAASRASVKKVEESMKTSGNGYWLPDRGAIPPPLPSSPQEDEHTATPRMEKLQVCSICSFAFCRVCKASWHGDLQICKAADGKLTEEEIANEKYLRENTTPCPTCSAPAIKSHGCNHMICPCTTHFCFLCSAYLDPANPYVHFNTRGTDCYQRLWEGEEGDEEHIRRVRNMREVAPQQPEAQAQPHPEEAAAGQPVEEFVVGEDGVVWIDGQPFEVVFEDETDSDSEAEFEVAFEDVPDEPHPRPPGRLMARRGGEIRGRGAGRGGGRGGGRGNGQGDGRGGRGRGRGGGIGGGRGAEVGRGGGRGGRGARPRLNHD
ncbi:RWD domain-containing protein [Trichophaea hybrida]|nr:RWD domain-containing protein [Trichophaea hybrida]